MSVPTAQNVHDSIFVRILQKPWQHRLNLVWTKPLPWRRFELHEILQIRKPFMRVVINDFRTMTGLSQCFLICAKCFESIMFCLLVVSWKPLIKVGMRASLKLKRNRASGQFLFLRTASLISHKSLRANKMSSMDFNQHRRPLNQAFPKGLNVSCDSQSTSKACASTRYVLIASPPLLSPGSLPLLTSY